MARKYTRMKIIDGVKPKANPDSVSVRVKQCIRDGKPCVHKSMAKTYTSESMCEYFLDTGKQRDCPAGKKCIYYEAIENAPNDLLPKTAASSTSRLTGCWIY